MARLLAFNRSSIRKLTQGKQLTPLALIRVCPFASLNPLISSGNSVLALWCLGVCVHISMFIAFPYFILALQSIYVYNFPCLPIEKLTGRLVVFIYDKIQVYNSVYATIPDTLLMSPTCPTTRSSIAFSFSIRPFGWASWSLYCSLLSD